MSTSMYGVDLGYYKQELTLRRPLFMHTVFHYKDAGAYRIASKHCRRRLKQELVTNKKLQQQIDYATGEIVYKQCAFRRCATYSNETDLHKYALDVYRTIRNYNQCIIVNFSQKKPVVICSLESHVHGWCENGQHGLLSHPFRPVSD
jgi:hypothetical protein